MKYRNPLWILQQFSRRESQVKRSLLSNQSMPRFDRQIHRLISRRKALMLLQATGGTALAVCIAEASGIKTRSTASTPTSPTSSPQIAQSSTNVAVVPACVVKPQQTEGPYFVDEKLNRSDIRGTADGSLKDGVSLYLTLRVSEIGNASCRPLKDAIVDIWHCDALGVYSDVSDRSFNTVGEKFLRGYQVTDATGTVQFTTIYPGWYQGRTVHIHFKIRGNAASQLYEFTSQLYFDDSMTDRVHTQPPYASKGQRTLRNAEDSIFRNGRTQLLLTLTQVNQGYAATFDIGLESA